MFINVHFLHWCQHWRPLVDTRLDHPLHCPGGGQTPDSAHRRILRNANVSWLVAWAGHWAGSSCSAALRSGQNCLILGQAGAATAREEEATSHVPAICCTERCLDNQILKTFVIKSTMSSIIIPLFSKILQTITTHHITIFRRSRSHATVCHSKIVTVCHVLIPSGRVGARSPD